MSARGKRLVSAVSFLLVCFGLWNVTAWAQKRLGLRIAPSGAAVLQSSDFVYEGAFTTTIPFTQGGIGGRVVGGHQRLFMWDSVTGPGSHYPPNVLEYDIDGLTPDPVLASAPSLSVLTHWGDITDGHAQSWYLGGDTCATPGACIFNSLYWKEDTGLLYYTYFVGYTDPTAWTLGATSLDNPTGPVTTSYGPWAMVATDQDATSLAGVRAMALSVLPDGKMLGLGAIKGGPTNCWGPCLYGGNDWPTTATPSGQFSDPIPQTHEYLDYRGTTTIDPHGQWTGDIKAFLYDGVNFTYPFEYFPGTDTQRIDPSLNSGRGTFVTTAMGNDSVRWALWYEGTYKKGVVFLATLPGGAAGTDPNDCSTDTSHLWYRNNGQLSATLSGITGSIAEGDTLTGASSHIQQLLNTPPDTTNHGYGGTLIDHALTNTETLHDVTSGATATVVSNIGIVGHNTALVVSGVSGTFTIGDYVYGASSGAAFQVTAWNSGTGAMSGGYDVPFIVGETVTNGTGGSGTVTYSVNALTCSHFCHCTAGQVAACSTGPSWTGGSVAFLSFDPAKLTAVAANSATDYLTQADYQWNLTTDYGILPLQLNINGGYFNPATKKLYLNAPGAYPFGGDRYAAIYVLRLVDAPSPEPHQPFPFVSLVGLTVLLGPLARKWA